MASRERSEGLAVKCSRCGGMTINGTHSRVCILKKIMECGDIYANVLKKGGVIKSFLNNTHHLPL